MTPPAQLEPRSGTLVQLAIPDHSRRRSLGRAVLDWHARHGRALAFRAAEHADPWGILVSEVMAQQTQISRVAERWPAFMTAFPTPAAMAAVGPAEVIRAWRGLGYNRRAVGLHRAAVAITAAGGRVPSVVADLEALPGVGPYTARAVAAIAFGRPVGAVDVNVRRVVGRIVAGDPATLRPAELQVLADLLVDRRRPGAWTHALMDLGATVCRPVRPDCPACPARRWCAATAGDDATGAVGKTRGKAERTVRLPAGRPLSRPAQPPFEETMRWLRGRIVDRLREVPDGAAVHLDEPLGMHSRGAVAAATVALARDGLVELDALGRARLAGSGEALRGGAVAGTEAG